MTEPAANKEFWRGVKVAAFVTLVGPPVGALLLLAFGSARALYTNGIEYFAVIDAAAVVSVTAWVSVFSYVFGGLTAFLSGVMLGVRTAKGRASGALMTLGIVAVALLITAVVFRVLPFRSDPLGNVAALVAFLAPLAAVSALVCRWFMIKIRLLPRI